MRGRIATGLVVVVAAAGLGVLAAPASAQQATPVDLRTWSQTGVEGNGVWEVAADGSEVVQTVNGDPTFFVSPDDLQPGQKVEGSFLVGSGGGDDDYIGFVFGVRSPVTVEPGEFDYDLFVFDWKQFDQGGCPSPSHTAYEGFTLMRVRGHEDFSDLCPTFWGHDDNDPRIEVLGTDYGPDRGWVHDTTYTFTLDYSPTHVTISIDDQVIFDLDGTFPIGRFGFYNYSQAYSTYNGFTETPATDPPPIRIDEETGDVKRVADLICQYLHTDAAVREVVLARDDVFADALAGASLAQDDGCVLFTPGGPDAPLDPLTRGEIDRVLPDSAPISILGGTQAVSQAVEDELRGAGYAVTRYSGATRIETAILIAEQLLSRFPSSTAGLAFAGNWPDAVAAGAWATDRHIPIVLTYQDALHPDTDAFLDRHGITDTVVLGGTAVVSDAAASSAPGPRRVFGQNRMGTAAEIAEQLWGNTGSATLPALAAVNLELANAWVLALAASPLSAKYDAPQVGVYADRVPIETSDYLGSLTYSIAPDVYVIGGVEVIDDATAQGVADATR